MTKEEASEWADALESGRWDGALDDSHESDFLMRILVHFEYTKPQIAQIIRQRYQVAAE